MNSIIKLLAFYLDICYRFKNKSILNLFKCLINIEERFKYLHRSFLGRCHLGFHDVIKTPK